ncbi:hypothetical protein Ais01nite_26440 [Asanoa ishikariensis]|uniref:Uncharacterized protein n=1 Tax=Asanoa ishikariensis TaxID=137265 RepID=A0A1H3QZG7_9ACTN|nr:hypothetical protein Ais01nite_26440 [Asanoa ishikariensis]SDZ18099.1 hypothetical protein SAMN05421684_3276 [Asanoa ishikariensis]
MASIYTTRPWSLSAAPSPAETSRLAVLAQAQIAPAYQAQAQTELILVPTAVTFHGTTASTVKGIRVKGGMDVSGVPPRSRPV